MDGVISLPVAFASYFLLPDFPFNTRVFYLNENVRIVIIIFQPFPDMRVRTKGLQQSELQTDPRGNHTLKRSC